ncbi:hypothetical protein E3N88_33664 [Mikania micrantha]|uniref:Uncharacterized protein n=1 Tax=Mikania micrantha TaxID=192012 RepID=A0A5N6MCM7_9ASTR|nr:hypothetical protein E3N88_33664 [Mikania micrantha]
MRSISSEREELIREPVDETTVASDTVHLLGSAVYATATIIIEFLSHKTLALIEVAAYHIVTHLITFGEPPNPITTIAYHLRPPLHLPKRFLITVNVNGSSGPL